MSRWNRRYVCLFALIAAMTFGVGTGFAEDMIAKGDALWKQRDSIDKAREAVAAYEAAAKIQTKDTALLIKIVEGYAWVNELTPESDKARKLELCSKGMAAAEKAIAIDPECVGARFWWIVLQGRYTEQKGLLSGFDFGNAMRTTFIVIKTNDAFYNGGIYRFWGRVIHLIPPIVGKFFKCETKDAIDTYQKAIKISPYFLETRLYMADTYLKINEKDKAKKELESIINTDLGKLPEYAPENRLTQRRAKETLAKYFAK